MGKRWRTYQTSLKWTNSPPGKQQRSSILCQTVIQGQYARCQLHRPQTCCRRSVGLGYRSTPIPLASTRLHLGRYRHWQPSGVVPLHHPTVLVKPTSDTAIPCGSTPKAGLAGVISLLLKLQGGVVGVLI